MCLIAWLLLGQLPYGFAVPCQVKAANRRVEFNIVQEDANAPPAEAPGEAPLQLLLVTWLVALANIGFGLFPQFPLALSSAAAELLLRHTL